MKITSKLGFIILFSAIFFSCNQSTNSNNETISEVALAAPADMKAMAGNTEVSTGQAQERDILNTETSEKKIIKDGSLSIKSKQIGDSKKRIDAAVKSLGAYYETENLSNNDQQSAYDLRIRIPAANFEKLLSAIEKGDDEIKDKSIHARDVTEEFVDLNARLESKHAYLKRYRDLLNKATTIKNILEIEEKIRVIQEEIESTQGRLKYLKDQVSFSTLSINLYQDKEYVFRPAEQDGFLERLKTAIAGGWSAIVTFLIALISIWPFLILITVAIYVYRRFKLRKK